MISREKKDLSKIGIYGGTFDPIHHGHLLLARAVLESFELDEMLFVPAAASPHKTGGPVADGAQRVEMIRAALGGEERFCLDERELQRPAPSYAIETIESMRGDWPEAEFFYCVGEDNLPRLSTWHRFEELKKAVQFIVLRRGPGQDALPFPSVDRRIDISATEIRNRVAQGRSIRYLVPPPVEEIIRRHNLYQAPLTSPPNH